MGNHQDNSPNVVEIGTLIVATLTMLGGFYKFTTIGHRLTTLETNLHEEELAYRQQPVLLVSGKITATEELSEYDHSGPGVNPLTGLRRINLALRLKNPARAAAKVENVLVCAYRADFDVQEILDPVDPVRSLIGERNPPVTDEGPPMPPREDSEPPPAPVPDPNGRVPQPSTRFGSLVQHISDEDGWKELTRWDYVPKQENMAGVILHNQDRMVQCDFLVQKGTRPQLFKFLVTVTWGANGNSGESERWTNQWIGVTGTGQFAKLFDSSPLGSPEFVPPQAAPPQAPEMPPGDVAPL